MAGFKRKFNVGTKVEVRIDTKSPYRGEQGEVIKYDKRSHPYLVCISSCGEEAWFKASELTIA